LEWIRTELQWVYDFLEPYGGIGGNLDSEVEGGITKAYYHSRELIMPLLEDEATYNRLLQLVRTSKTIALKYEKEYPDELLQAMDLLSWTRKDEAIEAIAPYLKHPIMRYRAVQYLGQTWKPKAMSYLIDHLHDWESILPSLVEACANKYTFTKEELENEEERQFRAEMEVQGVRPASAAYAKTRFISEDLMHFIETLARFNTDEARVAIDEFLKRFEENHGSSKEGAELLKKMQKARDEGIQFAQKVQRGKAVRESASTGLSTTTANNSISSASEAAKSSDLFLLVSLAIVFLAVLGYVFYRRK